MAQYFSTYWLRFARNNSISGVISHIIGLLATPSEKNLVPCPNMNILKVMWNRNFITIFYNGTFFVKKQKNVHSLDFTDGTTVSRRGNCKVRNTSPVASQIQRFRNCLSGWWCWSNNLSAPFFFYILPQYDIILWYYIFAKIEKNNWSKQKILLFVVANISSRVDVKLGQIGTATRFGRPAFHGRNNSY